MERKTSNAGCVDHDELSGVDDVWPKMPSYQVRAILSRDEYNRACSCVNAMRGIDENNSIFTSGNSVRAVISKMQSKSMDIEQQRDELLAALERLSQSGLALISIDEVKDREDAATIESNFNDELISAQKTIEKSKGGAA